MQASRKKQENFNLSVHDHCKGVVDVRNKPSTLNVYSRNYSRKKGGGKMITHDSQPVQKHEDALLGVTDSSEGELRIEGLSSSDDDTSSDDFNITSDIDVEAEREIQEEAAYEGIRCLLGDGRHELEDVKRREEVQVLTQSNHNKSSVHHSSGKSGSFLNALNIKLVIVDKENHDGGTSYSKRRGVRELRNLVCNVNYEKGLSGKGKNCLQ